MATSKSISLIAIFGAIIGILEIFPIIGITDIPFPLYPKLTIDPTGIVIILGYLILGFIPSLTLCGFALIFIGYRNIFGAIFKVLSELFNLIGFAIGFTLNRKIKLKNEFIMPFIFGIIFRVILMHISNYFLLQIFYGIPPEVVIALLPIIDIFNTLQGSINMTIAPLIIRALPKEIIEKFGNHSSSVEDSTFSHSDTKSPSI